MQAALQQAGDQALEAMRARGLTGDAFLMHGRELSIEVSGGMIQTLKEAEQSGAGIRVFKAGRVGFSYTTGIDKQDIERVVLEASRMADFSFPDESNGLPPGGREYPRMNLMDDGISSVSLEAKTELAREAEKAARSYHPSIRLVDKAGYEDYQTSIMIVNTQGLYAFGEANYCGLHVSLAAVTDDETQNGFAYRMQRRIGSLDASMVGEEAAMRAMRSLNARIITSRPMPCIIDSQMVTRFLGLFSASFQADSVQKGKSMLAGKTGELIVSPLITVVDDATCEEGIAAFPFDGEGVASQTNMVVKDGVLHGFLYDTHSARRAGTKSTGNAIRSFRSLPVVGSTNLILAPGTTPLEAMMDGIEEGLYVTEIMGMHTANPITGDFSLGAAGIMIEHGQLTYPVRGITIAGNLLTMLREADAIGSDWRIYGSKAAPSLRCTSLNVAGK